MAKEQHNKHNKKQTACCYS